MQVGVENSHVHEELIAEVCSSAAAPALLPPLGGRVQFLDSKQLGAAPYLVVHGDHMPRPPFVPVRLFSPALNLLCLSQSPLTRVSTWWSVTTAKVRAKGRGLDRIRPRILNGSHSLSRCALPPPRDCRAHTVLAHCLATAAHAQSSLTYRSLSALRVSTEGLGQHQLAAELEHVSGPVHKGRA